VIVDHLLSELFDVIAFAVLQRELARVDLELVGYGGLVDEVLGRLRRSRASSSMSSDRAFFASAIAWSKSVTSTPIGSRAMSPSKWRLKK
jgi:hypothetical protein